MAATRYYVFIEAERRSFLISGLRALSRECGGKFTTASDAIAENAPSFRLPAHGGRQLEAPTPSLPSEPDPGAPRGRADTSESAQPSQGIKFVNPRLRQHSDRKHRRDSESLAHVDLRPKLRVVNVTKGILHLNAIHPVVSFENEIEIVFSLDPALLTITSSISIAHHKLGSRET